jgi:hypothetical protein
MFAGISSGAPYGPFVIDDNWDRMVDRVLASPAGFDRWCTYSLPGRRIGLYTDLDYNNAPARTSYEHQGIIQAMARAAVDLVNLGLQSAGCDVHPEHNFIVSYDPDNTRSKVSLHVSSPFVSFKDLTHLTAFCKGFLPSLIAAHPTRFKELVGHYDSVIYNPKRAFVLPGQHKPLRHPTKILNTGMSMRDAVEGAMMHRPADRWPSKGVIEFKDEFLAKWGGYLARETKHRGPALVRPIGGLPHWFKTAVGVLNDEFRKRAVTPAMEIKYQGFKEGHGSWRLYLNYGRISHRCLAGNQHNQNNSIVVVYHSGDSKVYCEGTTKPCKTPQWLVRLFTPVPVLDDDVDETFDFTDAEVDHMLDTQEQIQREQNMEDSPSEKDDSEEDDDEPDPSYPDGQRSPRLPPADDDPDDANYHRRLRDCIEPVDERKDIDTIYDLNKRDIIDTADDFAQEWFLQLELEKKNPARLLAMRSMYAEGVIDLYKGICAKFTCCIASNRLQNANSKGRYLILFKEGEEYIWRAFAKRSDYFARWSWELPRPSLTARNKITTGRMSIYDLLSLCSNAIDICYLEMFPTRALASARPQLAHNTFQGFKINTRTALLWAKENNLSDADVMLIITPYLNHVYTVLARESRTLSHYIHRWVYAVLIERIRTEMALVLRGERVFSYYLAHFYCIEHAPQAH